ncbi:hypothetical protein V474_16065 [Novosphingobium barchaimii LL02]|uniref:Uncharacterized protein n=1 Tax=Novosphingobium barchaimii LL02 TaxID=1114963 RepID=A0A0J7XXN7_9SPHN|nr:hypothetical protein [Novosphingobium barchaimii]KMS56441.1 hypothetical protein V474_16065 [Novosphingobium barchaimii LL02]
MDLSSALCRAQEAVQRERANTASLENVRIQAGKAAIAWGLEAAAAEKREARHAQRLTVAELMALQDLQPDGDEDEDEFSIGENTDRAGPADPTSSI